MKTVSVFARVGVIINFETEEEITQELIVKEVKKFVEENDPGRLYFHFDGETYIPDGCVRDQDGNVLIEPEINFWI